MNSVQIVGHIVSDPQINETESGKKMCEITIAIPRCYKSINGEYDTDFIPVNLYNGVAESTADYCKKGNVISVKGRLTRLSGEDLRIIAERVTFISSRKVDEE